MSLEVATKLFQYGQHSLPLGHPYAYRIDTSDHTVSLYSLGGMGLEFSVLHEVTFRFPAKTAEKARKIADQLLEYTGPLAESTYYYSDVKCLLTLPGDQSLSQAYQITEKRVLKATDVFKSTAWVGVSEHVILVSEEYEFKRDLSERPSKPCIERLTGIQDRVDFLLEKRPHLTTYFIPFKKQLALLLSHKNPTQFEFELLDNSLEISDLKSDLSVRQWNDFKSFILANAEEGIAVAVRLGLPSKEEPYKALEAATCKSD